MMQTSSPCRAAIRSTHGLVAAQHHLAARAGAAVLARGGNAMDAAVVAILVEGVVEPWLCGLGGGGFLLHASADGAVSALDFNMRAPASLPPGTPAESGHSAIGVPGMVAGLAAALGRFGTLGWAEALAPAIAQAEQGTPMDWHAQLNVAAEAALLAEDAPAAALFLDSTRDPCPMPALAATLRRLAQAGPADFYHGALASRLLQDLPAFTREDLAGVTPEWVAPRQAPYAGWRLWAMPGPSGGPTCLDALRRLGGAGLTAATSAGERALRQAQALHAADARRQQRLAASCTSHVSVVDASGALVALTATLVGRFGARVVLPRTGLLMNNAMSWFDPRPGHPNAATPDARPPANMCPLLLGPGAHPTTAIGAAGGRSIVPALVQIVSALADAGLSLEEAFHLPRIDTSGPTVRVDARAAPDVAAHVAAAFPVDIVEDTLVPTLFGIPAAVQRVPGGAIGMAHPASPHATVATGDPALAA